MNRLRHTTLCCIVDVQSSASIQNPFWIKKLAPPLVDFLGIILNNCVGVEFQFVIWMAYFSYSSSDLREKRNNVTAPSRIACILWSVGLIYVLKNILYFNQITFFCFNDRWFGSIPLSSQHSSFIFFPSDVERIMIDENKEFMLYSGSRRETIYKLIN